MFDMRTADNLFLTDAAQQYRNRDVEYPMQSGFAYPFPTGIGDMDPERSNIGYPIDNSFTYPLIVERANAVGSLSADYFGPIMPSQTWDSYESFMSEPIYAAGSGALIGAMLGGPAGAILGALTGWAVAPRGPKPGSTFNTHGTL